MRKIKSYKKSLQTHPYFAYLKRMPWIVATLLCASMLTFGVVYYETGVVFEEEIPLSASAPLVAQKDIHIKTPEVVRGVYMSSWVAGVPELRSKIINLIDTTELNAVVIDVKDSSGTISFPIPGEEFAHTNGEEIRIRDIEALIKELHSKDIYIIGRVAVFQDTVRSNSHSELAITSKATGKVWKDNSRLAWIDPAAEQQWKYVEKIGKYAYSLGFDEINLDYVRYPSDGKLSDMRMPVSAQGVETKEQVITRFFEYIGLRFRESGIPTSVDIFGLTTMRNDDLGIGQKLEAALRNFDYVAPMTYPSHYGEVFTTFSNPNAHPGLTITESYKAALKKIEKMSAEESVEVVDGTAQKNELLFSQRKAEYVSKLRPWYQDFSYGYPYGVKEVRDQIDAGTKLGIHSFLLWNPKNVYTKDALIQTHE